MRTIDKHFISRVSSIIEPVYFQLSFVFAILVLIEILSVRGIGFNNQILAIVLPIFAIPVLLRLTPAKDKTLIKAPLILAAIFAAAVLIRLIPYINSEVPFGYDIGIYKYVIDVYGRAIPAIPEASLAEWVRSIVPQGFPLFTNVLNLLPGFDSTQIIGFVTIFMGAFIVLPIFIVTRHFFGSKVALIAAALYVISYTQFSVFTMAYLKNLFGIFFFLFAIYALEKRNYKFLVVMYAALGMFHRPEFLLFSLILIPYFIKTKDKWLLISAACVAGLIVPFWLPRLDLYFTSVTGAISEAGTFFNFGQYQNVALSYLPFAFAGFLYLLIKRLWNSLFFYFIINLIIVVGQIIFFRRFIIPLDIVVIIAAAVGISCTLLSPKGFLRIIGTPVLILVVVSSGISTIRAANQIEPLINDTQLAGIEWIANNTENNASVVASSYDAPWVLGWSVREVIAPGLFERNQHNKTEWAAFFRTTNIEVTKNFLDEYEGPLYIYYSNNPNSYLGLAKFDNQYFSLVYDDLAVVYRYYPGGVPYEVGWV